MSDNARLPRAYTNAIEIANRNTLGNILAISGSILSVTGILVNNILLNHLLAMQLWLASNPLLMIWSIGVMLKQWNGGLSIKAIAVMYFIAFVSGAYGLGIW
jgi:hypothetical protein